MNAEVGVLLDLMSRDCDAIMGAVKAKFDQRNVSLINTDFTCLFHEIVLFCMDYVRAFVASWPR